MIYTYEQIENLGFDPDVLYEILCKYYDEDFDFYFTDIGIWISTAALNEFGNTNASNIFRQLMMKDARRETTAVSTDHADV